MPDYRRTFVVAFSLAIVLLFTLRARADSWIGDSLELQVADADIVVRGTLETVEEIRGSSAQKGRFHVIETLKGKTDRTIDCVIPYDYVDNRNFAAWQKGQTELLVCLVKSERDRPREDRERHAAEWSVRSAHHGGPGIIPLNGDSLQRAATTDFQLLVKADDILRAARETVRADAVTKVPHEAGAAVSIVLDIPFGSALDASLHSKSANGLETVVNETLEAKASQWIKTDDEMQKLNGVSVLSHFKSEENIAALKMLLHDPSVQRRQEGRELITTYRVRAAALAVLKSWGVEATAVVNESAPSPF